MRMIKIPNCEYELFYAIRLEILRKVPFALINSEYLKEDKLAFFYFWDTDYIPEELKFFIVKPPHEPKFDFSKIKLPEDENQTKITDWLSDEEETKQGIIRGDLCPKCEETWDNCDCTYP